MHKMARVTQSAVEAPEAAESERRAESIRARLVSPIPGSRMWGWIGPLIVGAIAAVLRFVNLGRPGNIVFDETYYVKDALALLKYGFEMEYIEEGADDRIAAGNDNVFKEDEANYIVHPPIGKWAIALGIRLFGLDSFGWRFATALAGVLMAVVVARLGRRMFRSTILGCAAGLFVAVDGMGIATSRTAILDGILALFVIAGFACLVVDRDRMRERYAEWAAARMLDGLPLGDGPVLGWRPWRLAAGVLLGLAAATKWNGLYALAVFGILTVLWDAGARRAAGMRSPALNAFLRDGPIAFVTMVVTAITVYLTSWMGWLLSDDAWDRLWAAGHPLTGVASIVPDWLRSLWHYHAAMMDFHVGLGDEHPYESQPWTWLVMQRPVSFDFNSLQPDEAGYPGCGGAAVECSQAVLALGNPLLWWAGCIALVVAVWMWAVRRDWRAGAILAGLLATWVPWLIFLDRTKFAFYAVAVLPFMALALAYSLGLLMGGPQASISRRSVGVTIAGALVVAIVVLAWFFYPIYVDEFIPRHEWGQRMWLDSWI